MVMPERELYKMIGEMQSDIRAIRDDVAEMKPHVEDWKLTKQRGIGLGIASLFSGTAIGSFLSQIGALFDK